MESLGRRPSQFLENSSPSLGGRIESDTPMADIKLFRISASKVQELQGKSATVEKSLQSQIEGHMDEFLGIRFLVSEYTTGRSHSGRIDTLGIDENGSPVVVEYKRTLNENVSWNLSMLAGLRPRNPLPAAVVKVELQKHRWNT